MTLDVSVILEAGTRILLLTLYSFLYILNCISCVLVSSLSSFFTMFSFYPQDNIFIDDFLTPLYSLPRFKIIPLVIAAVLKLELK